MSGSDIFTLVLLLGLTAGATTILVLPWIIRTRERMKVHETIRFFVDKGQPPPSELLAGLAEPRRAQPVAERDLRAGILWLSVAVGIAGLFTAIVSASAEGDVSWALVPGFAAFPAAIGAGYVALWWSNRNKA